MNDGSGFEESENAANPFEQQSVERTAPLSRGRKVYAWLAGLSVTLTILVPATAIVYFSLDLWLKFHRDIDPAIPFVQQLKTIEICIVLACEACVISLAMGLGVYSMNKCLDRFWKITAVEQRRSELGQKAQEVREFLQKESES